MTNETRDKSNAQPEFREWVKALDSTTVTLWQEAMQQTRELHGDV